MTNVQRLGLLDQLMFKMEVGGMSPMHMCGGLILDTADSPYPVNGRIIADHLAACLEEIPLMRQRLVQDPLKLGDLRLVDDPGFNVRDHVGKISLAAPGGYDELTAALGSFSASRMDLSKPLWHMQVIDGLAHQQIAVAMHVHHAIIDGAGGLRMLEAMWSQSTLRGRKPRKKPLQAAALPTRASLLGAALRESLQRAYVTTPRYISHNARPLMGALSREIARRLPTAEANKDTAESGRLEVHKTSLNAAPISAGRAVAYLEVPFDEIKALRTAFDCSINDLALLLSSCALQHFFTGIGEQVDFDLVAGMPINLRAEDDTSAGNAVTFSRVNLHNTIDDIGQRLRAIVADTAAIKRSARPARTQEHKGSGIDYWGMQTLFSPLLLDAVISGVTRFNLMDKTRLFNVAVSNVPGPQVPLYMAGARLHSQVPMGPCTDSLGLNITVCSTDRFLVFGFHGCAHALRDKELLVEGLRQALQSLGRLSKRRRKPAAGKPRRQAKSTGRPKYTAGSRPKSAAKAKPASSASKARSDPKSTTGARVR